MDLSIFIVSYNTFSYTQKCIESIRKYAGKYTVEAIVVDNNSADGSVEKLLTSFPDLKIIANQHNYGFARGMNQAYKISTGTFVMTFNPDAEVDSQTIDATLDYLYQHAEIGLLAGISANSENEFEMPAMRFPPISDSRLWASLTRKSNPPFVVQEAIIVDWVFGTGLICNRKALEKDRMFDEFSFLFWEEYNLCKSIRQKGYLIVVSPVLRIQHHASVSFKKNRNKLLVARKLSSAWGFVKRKEEYGYFIVVLNSLFEMLDNGFLFLLVSMKGLFSKSNEERKLSLITYKAIFSSNACSLLKGKKYAVSYDKFASVYFNDGMLPELPLKYKSYNV